MISRDFILENPRKTRTVFLPKTTLTFFQTILTTCSTKNQLFHIFHLKTQPLLHFYLPFQHVSYLVVSTPLKNMLVKLDPFPKDENNPYIIPIHLASYHLSLKLAGEGTSADPSTVAGDQYVRNCHQRPGPGESFLAREKNKESS